MGECFYSDGTRYLGKWVNGLKNGPGTLILKDMHKYIGFWDNYK